MFIGLVKESGEVAAFSAEAGAWRLAVKARVVLIPHTLAATNFREKRAGDPVSLEFDLPGKYVGKLMTARAG
jgi:riboflavin synthase alpha subunit